MTPRAIYWRLRDIESTIGMLQGELTRLLKELETWVTVNEGER
jgi:hypothetical protein